MSTPPGPEAPEAAIVEAALSVLAKKIRAELVLGLLENFTTGQRTGRVVLEEFRRAEQALNADRPGLISRTTEGLRAIVRSAGNDTSRSNRWLDAARRITTGGPPEWERLRQVGRDKGEPIPEWEIFHGLHTLAQRPARAGRARVTPDAIEEAMDLEGGLGTGWSLHTYLRDMRARFGPDYRPRNPEELASTVLRVDAARQLLKPGGFIVGIRSGPAAPPRAIDEATMRALTENYREILARRLSTTASLELVGSPDRRHNGHRPTGTDIDNAMHAGAAIVRARRAREIADHARARAVELRTRQITSTSTIVFGMAGLTGIGLTAVGLFAGVKYQYTTVIGLTMAAMGTIGNTLKEWTPNAEVIAAPFRAFVAEHRAERAERAADHAVDRLYRGTTPLPAAWTRARAAMTSTRTITRPSTTAPSHQQPTSGPRPHHTEHPQPTRRR